MFRNSLQAQPLHDPGLRLRVEADATRRQARAQCFPLLGYEMNGTTSKPEDVIVTAANDHNARFTTDSRWCLSNLSRG
jgi:hypothetical protein